MIVVDANILIYAVDRDSQHHEVAKDRLESALSGNEPVGLPWSVLLAFLRIVTRPGILRRQLTVEQAVEYLDDWLDVPVARTVAPGSQHWTLLRGLLLTSGTAGNLTSDAHLAALAMECGARLLTFDHDFRRFKGLRVEIPEEPGS